jgi:hypothetical protein
MITRNYTLKAGDDWNLTFESSQLATASIYIQMKNKPDGKLFGSFTPIVNDNIITASLSDSITSDIPRGLYQYDLRVKRGKILTEYAGRILVI